RLMAFGVNDAASYRRAACLHLDAVLVDSPERHQARVRGAAKALHGSRGPGLREKGRSPFSEREMLDELHVAAEFEPGPRAGLGRIAGSGKRDAEDSM
ncbi:hypothetical protein QM306_39930, partial [Burkholderia cenocepacia]|nr:hypothetical protein [Burkholderia cenocepacia]